MSQKLKWTGKSLEHLENLLGTSLCPEGAAVSKTLGDKEERNERHIVIVNFFWPEQNIQLVM